MITKRCLVVFRGQIMLHRQRDFVYKLGHLDVPLGQTPTVVCSQSDLDLRRHKQNAFRHKAIKNNIIVG